MSKNRSSQRRPSALDLFKARAPAVPAPTNNNNDSSGAKALLRDDAPPLVLPKPPPREPTSSAFIGGYGREEGKKASAAAKVRDCGSLCCLPCSFCHQCPNLVPLLLPISSTLIGFRSFPSPSTNHQLPPRARKKPRVPSTVSVGALRRAMR